jgi:hypothetical protein
VLWRQICAVEDDLRVPLFLRDQRRAELTPAGRQLLADGPDAVQARITDISASQVCLAWLAGRRSRPITEFVALAHKDRADRCDT